MNLEILRRRIHTRLATEKGSFVYNRLIGSELHKLVRAKNLQEVHDQVESYCREAILPEIRKGFVLGIKNVRVIEKTLHSVRMEIDVVANNREIVTVPIQVV